jgi:hypothetical protein
VPLAMAEWRAEYCHSELLAADGSLRLEQAALGRGLYAPLWIDLDPRRGRSPLTWRRLTVGENLQPVKRDAAVAYRIQPGRDQFVIYRALTKPGNRSFLGYNALTSFFCGRFLPTGETKEIVNIE